MKQKLKQVFRLAQDNPNTPIGGSHRWKRGSSADPQPCFSRFGAELKKKDEWETQENNSPGIFQVIRFLLFLYKKRENAEKTHDMFDIHHDGLLIVGTLI